MVSGFGILSRRLVAMDAWSLIYILEKSDFTIIDTMWISGMLAYSSQLRLFYLNSLYKGKAKFLKLLFKAVSLTSNVVMAFLDKLEQKNGKNNAAIYFVVARKNSIY